MAYLFTSESVAAGHPDKMADQISDTLLDSYLAFDADSKVAIESLLVDRNVVLAGEVKSKHQLRLDDIVGIVRDKIKQIGYVDENKFGGFTYDKLKIYNFIRPQAPELDYIQRDKLVAGDQGIMFGYATNQTRSLMPLCIYIANEILYELNQLTIIGVLPYLGPDAKSQVTIEFNRNHEPIRINNIVVSCLHEKGISTTQIRRDLEKILFPKIIEKVAPNISKLFDQDIVYHINPTDSFTEGGPISDAGLTGRKIIVDTYGGRGSHGGGAFSGKDASKVDRSGAYLARYIAKNLVDAGVAERVQVQLSYIIGKPEPSSVHVNTYQTMNPELINKNMTDGSLAGVIKEIFKLSVEDICRDFKLKNPIYSETAVFGHMGRPPQKKHKTFTDISGNQKTIEVDLFTWEKLDHVQLIKNQLF